MNVVLNRKNSVWQRFTSILLVIAMVLSSMTITIADSNFDNTSLNNFTAGVSISDPEDLDSPVSPEGGTYNLVKDKDYNVKADVNADVDAKAEVKTKADIAQDIILKPEYVELTRKLLEDVTNGS